MFVEREHQYFKKFDKFNKPKKGKTKLVSTDVHMETCSKGNGNDVMNGFYAQLHGNGNDTYGNQLGPMTHFLTTKNKYLVAVAVWTSFKSTKVWNRGINWPVCVGLCCPTIPNSNVNEEIYLVHPPISRRA